MLIFFFFIVGLNAVDIRYFKKIKIISLLFTLRQNLYVRKMNL